MKTREVEAQCSCLVTPSLRPGRFSTLLFSPLLFISLLSSSLPLSLSSSPSPKSPLSLIYIRRRFTLLEWANVKMGGILFLLFQNPPSRLTFPPHLFPTFFSALNSQLHIQRERKRNSQTKNRHGVTLRCESGAMAFIVATPVKATVNFN